MSVLPIRSCLYTFHLPFGSIFNQAGTVGTFCNPICLFIDLSKGPSGSRRNLSPYRDSILMFETRKIPLFGKLSFKCHLFSSLGSRYSNTITGDVHQNQKVKKLTPEEVPLCWVVQHQGRPRERPRLRPSHPSSEPS
jgi:hypothetical protein